MVFSMCFRHVRIYLVSSRWPCYKNGCAHIYILWRGWTYSCTCPLGLVYSTEPLACSDGWASHISIWLSAMQLNHC